jgi:hypothetical protein
MEKKYTRQFDKSNKIAILFDHRAAPTDRVSTRERKRERERALSYPSSYVQAFYSLPHPLSLSSYC